MDKHKHYNVAILGGGPGGTSAAIKLAQNGASVVVCERYHYQEHRIGEMLSPWICPLLKELEHWEQFLKAGHLSSPGMICSWGSRQLYENEFIFNPYGSGWHINRCDFDRSLALAAIRTGAVVLFDTLVVKASYEQRFWSITIRQSGEIRTLTADFIIDASGRSKLGEKIFGTETICLDKLVGVINFFQNCSNLTTNDQRILIEATEIGWWYSAQLPKHKAIAVFMTDKDLLPNIKKDLESYWTKNLLATLHTKERMFTWHPVSKLRIYDACTSYQSAFSGQQWLAVGDAASTYDPLSGQGILKAITNGINAANAIIKSGIKHKFSFSNYNTSIRSSFNEYIKEKKLYYFSEKRWTNSIFWKRRL